MVLMCGALRADPVIGLELVDASLEVSFVSDVDSYYVLQSSDLMAARFNAEQMLLGSQSREQFRLPRVKPSAYFRVLQISRGEAMDHDSDGLRDDFELLYSPLLNPLDSEDAGEDYDRDGIDNAAEFTMGSEILRSERAERFSMRGAHGILINKSGGLWGWGWNGSNELALKDGEHRLEAARLLDGRKWRAISSGKSSSVALDENGALWAWGQAGGISNEPMLYDDRHWLTVASDSGAGLAVLQDHTLWSWKFTDNGKLRAGLKLLSDENDWVQVAVDDGFGAAIKRDGSLWVMGALGDVLYGPLRRLGTDNDWVSISANYELAVALKRDGSLWAFGELGLRLTEGRRATSKLPYRIGEASDWFSVRAGASSLVGLKEDGTVWAWGMNPFGQLAQPLEVSSSLTPVQVGSDDDWAAVEGGIREGAALKKDGSIWIWGTQLGDGSTDPIITPKNILPAILN